MQIVIWADEHDCDVWKTYCEILGIPAHATNAVLTVSKVTPNFDDEDEEEGGADEKEF